MTVHKLHTLAITWISNQIPLKNMNMIEFKNFDKCIYAASCIVCI